MCHIPANSAWHADRDRTLNSNPTPMKTTTKSKAMFDRRKMVELMRSNREAKNKQYANS